MKRGISLFVFLSVWLLWPAQAKTGASDVTPEKLLRLKELHRKAEEQVALDRFQDAMKTYDEILLEEPDDETAYANIGQIDLMFGEFAKAKRAFENALSIDPDNAMALWGLNKIKAPDGSAYPERDPDPPLRSALEGSADSAN